MSQVSTSVRVGLDPAGAFERFADERGHGGVRGRTGTGTLVTLTHSAFERHGEGAEDCAAAMGSDMGWRYILERYRSMT